MARRQRSRTERLRLFCESFITEYNPAGLDKWKAERADAKINETRTLTASIEKRIHNSILATLKETFGEDEQGWWRKLPLKVRQEATVRREADADPNELETYFNLIDYRDIVTSLLVALREAIRAWSAWRQRREDFLDRRHQ